jgi:hypothetical protein
VTGGCLSGGVTSIQTHPCPCPRPKVSDSDTSNGQSSMCQFAGSRASSGRIQLTSGARVDDQVPAWLHSSPVVYTATNKLRYYQASYGRRGCLSNKRVTSQEQSALAIQWPTLQAVLRTLAGITGAQSIGSLCLSQESISKLLDKPSRRVSGS